MRKSLLLWLAALLLMMGMMAGCSHHAADPAGEGPSVAEIAENIERAVELDGLKRGHAERLMKLYALQAEAIADFVWYTAESNVRADEWAVIQVKSRQDVDHVLAGIAHRLASQTAKFQDYRPAAFNLIENHVLETRGRLIVFAVSEEAAKIAEVFDKSLQQ